MIRSSAELRNFDAGAKAPDLELQQISEASEPPFLQHFGRSRTPREMPLENPAANIKDLIIFLAFYIVLTSEVDPGCGECRRLETVGTAVLS